MRTLAATTIVLALFTSLARAGDFGVQLGNPGYTDFFSASAGGRGRILVTGCTERQYGKVGGTAGSPWPATRALITGMLGKDAQWHELAIADQPASCAAVAVRGPDGALYVGGELSSNLVLGGARVTHGADAIGSYAFVARLDTIGGRASWLAADRSRRPEWAQVQHIAIGPGGEVAIAGLFHGELDWGLGVQKARDLDDGFVVVLDGKTGKPRWMASPREPGAREVAGLAFAGADLIVATNRHLGKHRTQLVLTAYAPGGAIRWRVQTTGAGSLWSDALAVAPSGDIVVAGKLSGSVRIGRGRVGRASGNATDPRADTDPVVLRFTATGRLRWAVSWPAGGDAHAGAVAFAGDELWVAGTYRDRVEVAGTSLTATGSASSFLAQLGPSGRAVRVVPIASPDFVDVRRMFADGGDLVVAGDLLTHPMMPWGATMIDSDAFVIRWSRGGPLPAIAPLAIPGWPRP